MSLAAALLGQLIHIAALAAAAPLLLVYLNWLDARLTGRVAPSWRRPWQSLARLARKQPIVAENASELFTAGPLVAAAAIGAAACLVPSFTLGMALSPLADMLVIAGLLALSRCAMALAAMDVGSAVGGMGASRTMTFGCIGEPAVLLVILTLGLLAGTTNLDLIAATQQESRIGWQAEAGLAFVALAIVAIVDAEAGPLGGRRRGAELGMLRQAMALEFSGYRLAIVEATAMLRLLLWLDLIAAVFMPFGIAPAGAAISAWPLGLALWVAKLLLLATALVLATTALGHLRLPRVPRLLGLAVLFALLAAAFLFAGSGSA